VSEDESRAITALSRIRNRLAHTTTEDIRQDDEQRLRNALEPLIPIEIARLSTEALIRATVSVIVVLLRQNNERARLRRLDQERALIEWRRRHTLTVEQVNELLAGEAIAESPLNEATNATEIDEEIRSADS
jgi:hypothetical protein